jgi:flavin reductase (DIM6/NTAB) family NADH-FMN oxidoreductase RutF
MQYAINILSEDQIEIGKFFAKSNEKTPQNILSEFYMSKNNSPFLCNSLASMDCNVVRTHSEGDHTIFIGEVTEIVVNEGNPLMFYKGKWTNL